MATIPGASKFLNAAVLANSQGISPQAPTVLDSRGSSSTSLLEVGRSIAPRSGLGISSRARQLNNEFLNSSAINTMFSLGIGAGATLEGLQQQILALRAGLSDSQLAPSLRELDEPGAVVDEEV